MRREGRRKDRASIVFVASVNISLLPCLLSFPSGLSTLLGVANVVQRLTPLSIKLATVVGMGLLIALIGMVSIHLVVPDPQTVVALGTFLSSFLSLPPLLQSFPSYPILSEHHTHTPSHTLSHNNIQATSTTSKSGSPWVAWP